MHEFEIIDKYFNWQNTDIIVGVGDDCAIVALEPQQNLVSTTDTLISGVHFPENTKAANIAYKSLAVNLSDLAAMGATPKWFSLGLMLPEVDQNWLAEFSASLKLLADEFGITLIGGDTTKGNMSITIHALGVLPKNSGLLRSGAKVGDGIFVSNNLGDAALAWQLMQNKQTVPTALLNAFNRPTPQVKLGLALRDIATSCIDISDGLLADFGHIIKQSQVGARIYFDQLPLSPQVKNARDSCLSLAGGDDYQLCWTMPMSAQDTKQLAQYKVTKIGVITQEMGLKVIGTNTKNCQPYRHF